MRARLAAALGTTAMTIATALLSACTTGDYDLGVTGAIPPARFADADPQDFGAKAPANYPIHGIDVSKYQGDIDWQRARQSGVSFAFIKATEGGDRIDPRFDDYWRGARAAGVAHAAYHFYYFCTPASQQAAWFIRNVPREALAMPPVVDMEWNHASPSCKYKPDPDVVRREMTIFLQTLERHYGKRPIIYTTIDFHDRNLKGAFGDYPFWLRSVAAHPNDLYPERKWNFWQYTGTGIVPGIKGQTDINVFAGSQDDWRRWLADARR